MIFVAVGTQKFPFNRLLRQIDDLVARNVIREPVIAQTGNSDYQPKNYEYRRFFQKDDFEDHVKSCDLLITHSGVATIITGLRYEKKVIVVPRLCKFAEHVDDHQVQIAQSFSRQNLVFMCGEKDDLADLLRDVRHHSFSKYVSQRNLVVQTIREYLKTI